MLKAGAFLTFAGLSAYGATHQNNPVFLCSLAAALWVFFADDFDPFSN